MTDTEQLLSSVNLVYLNDSEKGIQRIKKGKKFEYKIEKVIIKDENTLSRIKQLAIPPAWTQVWISEKDNAHLQCTGLDVAGRKQYRYHSKWVNKRNETKYYRLLEFGKVLPDFRKKLARDLRRKELDERKVLAISIYTMQKTLIRIGNQSYKQLYKTFGLSTLEDRHVKISDQKIQLSFVGKKGIKQNVILKDRVLADLFTKCKDIPGQQLFQYYTIDGDHKSINSGMMNNYIKEITNCDFTAKDFRTWSGTLETLRFLASNEFPESLTARKKIINCALDVVSKRLGNTRTVCRKSYVFPPLLDAYENGQLNKSFSKMKKDNKSPKSVLHSDEKVLLSFLKNHQKQTVENSKK